MTALARAALISLCVLAIGLLAVHLEVEHRRCGVQIRQLLDDREDRLEKIRRLETRYNRLVSPDVLEQRLLEDFGPLEPPVETKSAGRSRKAGT